MKIAAMRLLVVAGLVAMAMGFKVSGSLDLDDHGHHRHHHRHQHLRHSIHQHHHHHHRKEATTTVKATTTEQATTTVKATTTATTTTATTTQSTTTTTTTVAPSDILFLVRTGGPNSPDRLKAIGETWGKDIPASAMALLQSFGECESAFGNNHGKGLTCLESKNELSIANTNRTDYLWLAIVDDDVYVNVKNLKNVLHGLNPSDKKVYGIPGCGHCNPTKGEGTSGFCGGGGYFISRENLMSMTADNAAFYASFNSDPDQDWCDVRFACVASTKGLPMQALPGLYGWQPRDGNEENEQIHGAVPPLTFHYADPDRMRRLDLAFNNTRVSFLELGAQSGSGASLQRYYMQMDKYVREENMRRGILRK